MLMYIYIMSKHFNYRLCVGPRGRRAVHVIQIDSLLNSKWSIVKDKVNNLLYISVTILISEVGAFKMCTYKIPIIFMQLRTILLEN